MATVKQPDLSGYSTEELEETYRKNLQENESGKGNPEESHKFRRKAEMNMHIRAELDKRNERQD